MNKWLLYFITVAAGATILALELLASRMMVPIFGTSLIVWGAVLSTTLVCLALGYSIGGRIGDTPHAQTWLTRNILISAIWIACLPFFSFRALRWVMNAGAMIGPVLAVTLLLCVPLILLSTVVPLIIGTKKGQHRSTAFMGNLFALSTMGSVLGALVTAYWAIPYWGINKTCLASALLLSISAIPLFRSGTGATKIATGGALLLFCIGLVGYQKGPTLSVGTKLLEDKQTLYGRLQVVDDLRDDSRIMLIDGASQAWATGATHERPLFLYCQAVLDISRRYALSQKRALVIGLGGGTLVRMLAKEGFRVDVVDIDPAVVDAAYSFFDLGPDDASVFIEDGRTFLSRHAEDKTSQWDLILIDASGQAAPEHLYNQDAFRLAQKVLDPKGILIAHIVGFVEGPNTQIIEHVGSTMASVFASSEAIVTEKRKLSDLVGTLVVGAGHAPVTEIPRLSRQWRRPIDASRRVLSDQWNPMSRWSAQSSRRWRNSVMAWLGQGAIFAL